MASAMKRLVYGARTQPSPSFDEVLLRILIVPVLEMTSKLSEVVEEEKMSGTVL